MSFDGTLRAHEELHETEALADIRYTVRRSRVGRFNFTLTSEAGRIEGSVTVSTAGKTDDELDLEVREKIQGLAKAFHEEQGRAPVDRQTVSLSDIRQRDIRTW